MGHNVNASLRLKLQSFHLKKIGGVEKSEILVMTANLTGYMFEKRLHSLLYVVYEVYTYYDEI